MEEQKTCETCAHFHQHYVKFGKKRYDPINVGHCGMPRIRDKAIDTPACRWYKERT